MDEKRLEVLERATSVYMKFGIKSVTMDDLARELGISKKTIYKYFTDKNQLVTEIIEMKVEMDQALCVNCAQQAENAVDDLLSMSKVVIEHLGNINPVVFYDLQKHYPDAWQVIEKHKWNFVLSVMKENLKRGIEEGLYRSDLNVPIIGRQYVVAVDMIMDSEIYPWPKFKFENLFQEIMRFQLHGMVNDAGRKLLKERI